MIKLTEEQAFDMKEYQGQGLYFKDPAAFESGVGICYVAEFDETEGYTREDFLNLVDGNPDLAQQLFDAVDWQHPETLLDEGVLDDDD